jgi:DNA-binding protein HU-beta
MRLLSTLLLVVGLSFIPTSASAMNKKEMASKLAQGADISPAKAAEIINIIFSTTPGTGIIATELDAGRSVSIPGFGTFGTRKLAAREGSASSAPKNAVRQAKFEPGPQLAKMVEVEGIARAPKAGAGKRAQAPLVDPALTEKLAKAGGISRVKASELMLAIFDARPGKGIIATELDAGRTVSIPGFGTFATGRVAATTKISARTVARFKPSKGFSERLND